MDFDQRNDFDYPDGLKGETFGGGLNDEVKHVRTNEVGTG
jgi:hypothetical protein